MQINLSEELPKQIIDKIKECVVVVKSILSEYKTEILGGVAGALVLDNICLRSQKHKMIKTHNEFVLKTQTALCKRESQIRELVKMAGNSDDLLAINDRLQQVILQQNDAIKNLKADGDTKEGCNEAQAR